MKKILLTTIITSVILLSTSCGKTVSDTNSVANKNNTTVTKETNTDKLEEIPIEQPIDNVITLKETGTISTWNITVNKVSFTNKISDSAYFAFSPDNEGDKFLIVNLKVENIGKKSNYFLPSFNFNDISAKLLFKDEFEFSMTNLLGYNKSLMDTTINPLSSQSGNIVFEVPEKVYNSKGKLTLNFYDDNETLIVNLR